nr:hypothetical protein [Tanacetum cinerariifolium]
MEDDVDINTLTMEQYLAWVQDDIRLAVVKPKIGNDVKFEINSNFMRELRRKIFKGTDDEDAHKHDLLEKAFIKQYYPPFKTAKKLEEIRNFKQEVDEPLYRTWERSDLLQISAARPEQPTKDHSCNWYDEATTREIINDSLDDVDIKKLDENIHVFQGSCKTCEGMHLTEDCTIRKEDKAAADDAWIRKFIKNTDSNIRELKTTTKNLQVIADQLTHTVLINTSERIKAKTKIGKNDMKELVPRDLPVDY